MEDEVFEGLEELFSGIEQKEFESFFSANKVGVETNVSTETNPDNNNDFFSADLQEQVSNDETDEEMVDPLLDEDLDEVMESFLKKSQETQQVSEEMISEEDDLALTVAALLDLEQNVVVHETENLVEVVVLDDGEKGVHHHDNSGKGKRSVAEVDVEVLGAVPGGFMRYGDDASWRNPSAGSGNAAVNQLRGGYVAGNNYRYDNFIKSLSWNAKNANPWSHLTTPGRVLGGSSAAPIPVPSFSSSLSPSSSGDTASGTPPRILLGGVLDIASVKLDKNTSFGNPLHAGHLGQPDYSSSSSSSPPTPWNNLGSPFGAAALWPESGVFLSQPPPGFENFMTPNQSNSGINKEGPTCEPPRKRRIKAAEVKLPPGWEVVTRVRKNGKSKGQIDKYYINRTTGQRARSLPELYRLLGLQPDGSEASTS